MGSWKIFSWGWFPGGWVTRGGLDSLCSTRSNEPTQRGLLTGLTGEFISVGEG